MQKCVARAAWTDYRAVKQQAEVIDVDKELGYGRRLRGPQAAVAMPARGGKTCRKKKIDKGTPNKTKV